MFPGRRGRAEWGASSCQRREGKYGLKVLALCNALENIWAATVTVGTRLQCTQIEGSWATLKKKKEVKTPGPSFGICRELLHVTDLLFVLSTLKNELILRKK